MRNLTGNLPPGAPRVSEGRAHPQVSLREVASHPEAVMSQKYQKYQNPLMIQAVSKVSPPIRGDTDTDTSKTVRESQKGFDTRLAVSRLAGNSTVGPAPCGSATESEAARPGAD